MTVEDIYLTMDDVAKRLGVGQEKVRQLIQDGHLLSIRLGHRTVRIAESALLSYITNVSYAGSKARK